jgi:hypothetical protein
MLIHHFLPQSTYRTIICCSGIYNYYCCPTKCCSTVCVYVRRSYDYRFWLTTTFTVLVTNDSLFKSSLTLYVSMYWPITFTLTDPETKTADVIFLFKLSKLYNLTQYKHILAVMKPQSYLKCNYRFSYSIVTSQLLIFPFWATIYSQPLKYNLMLLPHYFEDKYLYEL